MKKTLSLLVLVMFGLSCVMPSRGLAQALSLPQPGTMMALSPATVPAQLKGMVIDPKSPFKLGFIVYRGDAPLPAGQKQPEYTKLIKYFLAALAVPDSDQWVNLSPYEKNRIIPDNFGQTEMGRDLLAQDYILKQISSSLTNPDTDLGKKFWESVYAQAQEKLGTTDIPTDTFNKVWIIPDKAVIYEKGNAVYVLEHHLKVMMEADYLAMKNNGQAVDAAGATPVSEISGRVMREVILPAIEKEVNEGANFAQLRQVYSGMLLAAWYKRALKESILTKLYGNASKVKGIDQDPKNNQQIYDQYVAAFKAGVFNMIREDVDKATQQIVPRKYFSGGAVADGAVFDSIVTRAKAVPPSEEKALGNTDFAQTDLQNAAQAVLGEAEWHTLMSDLNSLRKASATKKVYQTRADFEKYLQQLIAKIKASGREKEFNTVVSIARGGIPIGSVLSEALGKPNRMVRVSFYDGEVKRMDKEPIVDFMGFTNIPADGQGLLFVDDLVDTGATRAYIARKYPKALFACILYDKDAGAIPPDFYVAEKPKAWIVLPWDQEGTNEYRPAYLDGTWRTSRNPDDAGYPPEQLDFAKRASPMEAYYKAFDAVRGQYPGFIITGSFEEFRDKLAAALKAQGETISADDVIRDLRAGFSRDSFNLERNRVKDALKALRGTLKKMQFEADNWQLGNDQLDTTSAPGLGSLREEIFSLEGDINSKALAEAQVLVKKDLGVAELPADLADLAPEELILKFDDDPLRKGLVAKLREIVEPSVAVDETDLIKRLLDRNNQEQLPEVAKKLILFYRTLADKGISVSEEDTRPLTDMLAANGGTLRIRMAAALALGNLYRSQIINGQSIAPAKILQVQDRLADIIGTDSGDLEQVLIDIYRWQIIMHRKIDESLLASLREHYYHGHDTEYVPSARVLVGLYDALIAHGDGLDDGQVEVLRHMFSDSSWGDISQHGTLVNELALKALGRFYRDQISRGRPIAPKVISDLQATVTGGRQVLRPLAAALLKEITGDASMKGGIDLNAASLDMQIKRDGAGVPLPVGEQDLRNIHIDGLVPVIVSISPVLGTIDLLK